MTQVAEKQKDKSKSTAFIDYIIKLCNENNGARAALTRAENPSTEYQSWEYLARFVDIDSPNKRLPYAMVAASIARNRLSSNGFLKLGGAIAKCYEDGKDSDQAKAKLRRLLACDNVAELCAVLRPLLRLIESKANGQIDYAKLLDESLWFANQDNQMRIKSRWAQDFFGKKDNEDEQ